MAIPRVRVIGLVLVSVCSIALVSGTLVVLTGAGEARASTETPAPSTATVGVRLSGGVLAALRRDVLAALRRDAVEIPTRDETLPLGPVDPAAIAEGFRDGGYRFSVRCANFPSFAAAMPLETGVVSAAEQFVLEWPDARFISRYARDDENRTAWIGDTVLDLAAGDGWERTPDEMLPVDFYAVAIEPWTSALPAGSRDGTYTAPSEALVGLAESIGFSGADWTLSVTLDRHGRLLAARFAGSTGSRPFLMDIAVVYDEHTGASIERNPSADEPESVAGAAGRGDRGR